ncbi:hypothetical protein HYFRA_00001951 [Hymenoscyphus fraxineus]|uniref:Laccase n=1 Tax=Hymenoscyphus fraxineus TaxID=746836 RepID=A0A9N9KKV3_9HELO|nr:hypothetical protein HYFRA_00001951 [Hymenoscyphus fraxineus]
MLLPKSRLLLLTTFLVLTAILYYTLDLSTLSSRIPIYNPFSSTPNPENLGVILHPDEHIYREPKTIKHVWAITKGLRSPDGVEKSVYLINGQFPGPLIEARSGDELIIEVRNGVRDEGVAIHWHGLWMKGVSLSLHFFQVLILKIFKGANEMDGVVGLTQCPIKTSKSFTYKFKIDDDQAGTYWYHAHSELQRADGMYGSLVIHKPATSGISEKKEYGYDDDINLLIGDWYHRPSHEVQDYFKDFSNAGNEVSNPSRKLERNIADYGKPAPDSLVINGKGYFNCSMAVPARPVRCKHVAIPQLNLREGKTRLRIVNTGAMVGYTISLIGYTMTVIQVDGGSPVSDAPNALSIGILYPGERMDILIEPSSTFNSQTAALRIELDPENLQFPNFALTETQSFPITTNLTSPPPTPLNPTPTPTPLFNLPTATGPPLNLPKSANENLLLYTKIEILGEYNNAPKGFINQTTWSQPHSRPLITVNRSEWGDVFIPFVKTGREQWVDIVLNNFDDKGHPFHLHGTPFHHLTTHSFGLGGYAESYNPFGALPTPAPSLNTANPVRKDTVFVPSMGYVVLRVKVDNPGLWFFHCHVLWHQDVGMAMGFHFGEVEEGFGRDGVEMGC